MTTNLLLYLRRCLKYLLLSIEGQAMSRCYQVLSQSLMMMSLTNTESEDPTQFLWLLRESRVKLLMWFHNKLIQDLNRRNRMVRKIKWWFRLSLRTCNKLLHLSRNRNSLFGVLLTSPMLRTCSPQRRFNLKLLLTMINKTHRSSHKVKVR